MREDETGDNEDDKLPRVIRRKYEGDKGRYMVHSVGGLMRGVQVKL